MKILQLFNTLGKKKEEFRPLAGNTVGMYVCGITPYDMSHIGHGRCYVAFDVLFRFLKLLGYEVTYVRNFTDIDDKILNKAKEQLGDRSKFREIAAMYIAEYSRDMNLLGCLEPSYQPKVTENIKEIIAFIEVLIAKGKAYVVDGDVYFDTTTFSGYGKLSGKNIEELLSGARVEVVENKRNPQDFVLWKGVQDKTFWKSPWGYGRPGWHIECSALAKKYIGDRLDIHAGGVDLIFPHHENEIAQSEGLSGKKFAQFWLHNAFVNIDKEKMSKSLGNIVTLREIFERFEPQVLRFYYLQHHYRTPIDFSFEYLEASRKAYKKLVDLFSQVNASDALVSSALVEEMSDALCHDLNTPRLLAIIFENLDLLQSSPELASGVKWVLVNILGLDLAPLREVKVTDEIRDFLERREQARASKNWKLADELREKLRELGYEVQDKKL